MADTKLNFKKVASYPTSGVTVGDVIFCTGDHTIYVATGATTKEAFYGGRIKDIKVAENGTHDNLVISYLDGTPDLTIDFSDINTTLEDLSQRLTQLEGKAPVAGKDIDITGENNAIDVALDEAITVMGVSVGTLANGSTLKKGMSLSDILKQILIREIDAKVGSKPSIYLALGNVIDNAAYEVGTPLTATLSHTYTDGRFIGADPLYQYNLAAGCKEGTTTYKFDNTTVTSPHSLVVTEGTHIFNCTTTYGASTAKPKKNNGTASSVSIPAGTATSENKFFVGKFYGYVGYSTKTAGSQFDSASIKKLAAAKTLLTVDGRTTLLSGGTTSDGTSIVIAVPAKYKLVGIQNSLGVSILENFNTPVQVNYTNGETTTAYHVYVYPITSGAKVAYKNVVIAKA